MTSPLLGADVNLITLPLRLPFLPMKSVIRLAQVIADEADQQLYDPALARRELEETYEARERGAISDEDVEQIEREITGRLIGPPRAEGG